MPKIRDLGISHIPATMRPPEIGPGGAYDMPAAPDAAFPMGLSTCPDSCPPGTCDPNSGCQTPSPCPGNSCPNDSKPAGVDGYDQLGGLTYETITQLKQHLQDRIGTQFHM